MLTFVAAMQKGESLHLDVAGLPADAFATAKSLRDRFLPELPLVRADATSGASTASCALVAPYAGWFKFNLVMLPRCWARPVRTRAGGARRRRRE